MNYEIIDEGIIEKYTGSVIKLSKCDKLKISTITKMMNDGCGFNGHTPNFFLGVWRDSRRHT